MIFLDENIKINVNSDGYVSLVTHSPNILLRYLLGVLGGAVGRS